MKQLFIMLVFISVSALLTAQENRTDSLGNPFEALSKRDPQSGATIQFHHDKRIEQVVMDNAIPVVTTVQTTAPAPAHGFRVQVYSSNTHRVAKDEAFNLESILKDAFPGVGVYVSYTSPFWKVRIGDFGTQQEARVFTDELLRKFPRLKSATYTVRERIAR